MLAMNRPAIILSDPAKLDTEFKNARWIHHRLLDFEDKHQEQLDQVGDECAPGIRRVGSILRRLKKRVRRWERDPNPKLPHPRPELQATMQKLLGELRKTRNKDERWKAALKWAHDPMGDPVPRRNGNPPGQRTRRQHYRMTELYANYVSIRDCKKAGTAPRIHYTTWTGICKQVDQAREAVLKIRKAGMPADWHRPRWDSSNTLYAEPGHFDILERGKLWWTVRMRIAGGGASWVKFKCKFGNWHEIPPDAEFKQCKLTRRKRGDEWVYSASISVAGVKKPALKGSGVVAFDWGHREFGHPNEDQGMRVFTWVAADGRSGEVLLPKRCRALLDQKHELLGRMDAAFNQLNTKERNRHTFRKNTLLSGVIPEDVARWLTWEARYEKRIDRLGRRICNIRRKTYETAIRELRRHYDTFIFESETGQGLRDLDTEEMTRRRKRQNRELSSRYLFVSLCSHYGAEVKTVSAKNTTRECPTCGHLGENTASVDTVCPACNTWRDKDFGAATIILRRGQQLLAET